MHDLFGSQRKSSPGNGRRIIHIDLNPEQVTTLSEEMIQALKNNQSLMIEYDSEEYREEEISAYQLLVANALWSKKDYPFKEDYTSLVRSRFDA